MIPVSILSSILVASFVLSAAQDGRPPVVQGSGATGGTSAEKLLAIARERAERMRSEASTAVPVLISQMDALRQDSPAKIDKLIETILAYRELAIAPLILALDAPEGDVHGSNCALALSRLSDPEVTAQIAKATAGVGAPARARMAWVLGRQPGMEPLATLHALLADPDPAVSKQAAASLGRKQSPASIPKLVARLATADAPIAREILAALASLADPAVLAALPSFVEGPAVRGAVGPLADLLSVFASRDNRRDLLLPFLVPGLKLLSELGVPSEEAAAMLRVARTIVNSADREAISLLKRLLNDSSSLEVRTRAAYALDAARDPSGAAWLLKQPNEALRDAPDNTALLRQRGSIYLELRRYREAARDYEEIRRVLAGRRSQIVDPTVWLELARSHAGARNFPQAAEAVKQAVARGMDLRSIRDLEEFAEMRKSSRWSSAFDEGDGSGR